MTLDELLGFQRATLSPSPGNGPNRDSQPQEMVAIKVMVTPEARTALRLRKATTATDSGDLIRSLIDSELTAEIGLIRERSEGCHAGRYL